jgi:hypothetical protein
MIGRSLGIFAPYPADIIRENLDWRIIHMIGITRRNRTSFAFTALSSFVAFAMLFPATLPAQEMGGRDRGATSQPAEARGGARGGDVRGAGAARGGAQAVNLEQQMSAMGRAFKQLQAQIKDKTKNESSLTLIMQMESATAASKLAVPPSIRRLPEADRPKQTTDYRSMMTNLLKQELELEEKLLAGDNTKAADTLAAMDEIEKMGHQEFNASEGGEGRGGAEARGGGEARGGARGARGD